MFIQHTVSFASHALKVLLLVAACCGWNLAVAQPEPVTAQEQVLQVNVNSADAETIADILVGVGITRAQAIVEYRSTHGPFGEISELIQVKGIGEATLESNKNRIRLD